MRIDSSDMSSCTTVIQTSGIRAVGIQTRMTLESRAASCSGRFTFEGHDIPFKAL